MLVGAVFGAPSGMVVGTIVGHFQKRTAIMAIDAQPEGVRPYVLGLVAPLAFLAVAVPAWIWMSVKLLS